MSRRLRRLCAALVTVSVTAGCSVPSCRPSSAGSGGAGPAGTVRFVTDMRGATVAIPTSPTRVATIDDGFVEGVMTRIGVIRSLVAIGSSGLQDSWSYTYPTGDGRGFAVADGMGTMRALHPWLANLPCASCSGDAINYETTAAAKPDVVILRVGDCTIGTAPELVTRTVNVFSSMGIPAVVLRSPADYRSQGLDTLRHEIELIGRVFGRERDASALAAELNEAETLVRTRVGDVRRDAGPRVLYLGLASAARSSGGAAYVWGTDTAESWMLETIIGARNAYRGPGSRVLLNAEQVLTLDPDVIFLPTAAGYHPPRELAEAPYFRQLQRLRAVREKRVYALPWSPQNCARRLEYPLDLLIMAKGAYPDRFRDIAIHEWALAFYRRTYGVDEPQARALRHAQWLDWTAEAGF